MNNLTSFDATKFKLGGLCKRSHQYQNTGKSLRTLHGDCVECKRLDNEERCRLLREQSAVRVQERKKAKQKAQQPLRELEALHNVDTSVFKVGNLCSNNHDWNSTGYSLRYKGQGSCVECRKFYLEKYNQENKQTIRAKQKEYEARRPEIHQKAKAKYREVHREKIRAKNREYSKREEVRLKARINGHKRRVIKHQVRHLPYTKKDLAKLAQMFGNACAYCGQAGKLTYDHWIPLSRGGTDVVSNLLPACVSCNCRKSKSDGKTWYEQQSFYSKTRWRRIVKHLGESVCNGQIVLL